MAWEGWNRESEDYLTWVWGMWGMSAESIARELDPSGHLSRSGVIGKAHRLKLPEQDARRTPGPRMPRRPRRPRALPEIPETSMRLAPPSEQPAPERVPELAGSLPPDTSHHGTDMPGERPAHACTLLELNADTCRWPHGDPHEG